MPHVIVLGGGFAGFSAAMELQRRRRSVKNLRITLIDRNNFMLFTPMLPEVATGSVEPRHITQPLRGSMPHVEFELGEVLGVDEAARCVHVRHPLTRDAHSMYYDELVFALGSTPATHDVPGVAKCAIPLHTIGDAERLRNAVIGALESASNATDVAERDRLLRFVIVGGGFTGVETAGELSAFVRSIARYYPVDPASIEVVLVQHESRLLPHLPDRFGKFAARSLFDRGIRILLESAVESVDSGGVTLANGDRLQSRTIVWDGGVEPSIPAKQLKLQTNSHGAISVERDFSIPGHPHLWAIGDCAAVPRAGGGTYAPLAQNAVREGPLLARNLLARLRNRSTRPFRYRELGQMASLGNRDALAELPGGAMLTGTAAWILWRGYYLSRLPGKGRKARVAMDWTFGVAFPPQFARLSTAAPGSFDR